MALHQCRCDAASCVKAVSIDADERKQGNVQGFSSGLKVSPKSCFCWLAKQQCYLFTRWQFADAHPFSLDQMPSLGQKMSLWYGHKTLGLRPLASPVVFGSRDEIFMSVACS